MQILCFYLVLKICSSVFWYLKCFNMQTVANEKLYKKGTLIFLMQKKKGINQKPVFFFSFLFN